MRARPILKLLFTATGIALALFGGESSTAAQSLWEFEPYRVRLFYAFADDPRLTECRELVTSGVAQRVDAYIGAPWQIEINIADGALHDSLVTSLDAIDPASLPDGAKECEKIWLLAIIADGSTLRVRAREYDVLTTQWGPIHESLAPRVDRLAETAFRALLAIFAPVAEVETVVDKTATLRFRGGALLTRDPNVAFVQPSALLRPVLRSYDRDGKTRKIQVVEWTFLLVESNDKGQAKATLYTGVRSPLARRKRGRIQQLALAVRGASGTTQLEILSREQNPRPLAGYEVLAYGPNDPTTSLLGYSNAFGAIDVPPGPTPLRLLLVKSGNELLARLPIVPGLEPKLTVRLADDTPRLAAEGFLLGLQDRLIDVIVRRQVLIGRIKLFMGQGKFDDAGRLMDELRRLDSQQQFLLALDQEQQKSISSDPGVQRKIDNLFSAARQAVGEYLDPREVNRTEVELDQARRAQASAATTEQSAQ